MPVVAAQVRAAKNPVGISHPSHPESTTRQRIAVRPNPSLNLTRYGRRRKPGLQYASYSCSPGLRRLPTQSG